MKDLTQEQRDVIRKTWQMVEDQGLTEVAMSMYIKLFTDHPHIQPMFPFAANKKDMEELKASPRFRRHAAGVFKTIGTAISRLDNILSAAPDLVALGAKHYKYNIKPEHFKPIGESLLFVLGQTCGDGFTPDAVEAWTAVYSIVEMAMLSGFEAVKSSKE